MNIRAKKSLGQNFLKSVSALNKIVETVELKSNDIVVEVGPGKGALTAKILETGAKIFAVEKDSDLVIFLKEKFASEISSEQLILVCDDILSIDLSSPPYELKTTNPPERAVSVRAGYKLLANLPYYITGQFLRQYLGGQNAPSEMVLLLQKEVAKRIVASDGKESVLSLSVKAYGTPKYIETVKAKYFSPEPKVDSAIISIKNINRDFFTDADESLFFEIIKTAFNQKRKIAMTTLKKIAPVETLKKIWAENQIPPNARPENIPLEKWLKITKELAKKEV